MDFAVFAKKTTINYIFRIFFVCNWKIILIFVVNYTVIKVISVFVFINSLRYYVGKSLL